MMLGTGIIGGGTFPSIVGLASHDNSFSTSHSMPYPGGTTVAGELLIAVLTTNFALSSISGWTTLRSGLMWTGYRVADGTEGASLSFTLSNARVIAALIYRVSGYAGSPEIAGATGTGANPNPPSLTASWGVKKTLWLAACGAFRASGSPQPSISGFPSGFSGGIEDQAYPGSGSSVAAGGAYLENNATDTIDPGTFTVNTGTIDWDAVTIAIRGV